MANRKMFKGRLCLILILTIVLMMCSFALAYRIKNVRYGESMNLSTEQYDNTGVDKICLYNITLDPSDVYASLDPIANTPFDCESLPADATLLTPIHDNTLCQDLDDERYCHWDVLHECTTPVCDLLPLDEKTYADCSYFDSGLGGIVPCACPEKCKDDGLRCDCSNYAILTSKVEFNEDFEGMSRYYYYCGETLHGGSTGWNWSGDDIFMGCYVARVTKPPCPNDDIPALLDTCYKPDYYNWGVCNCSTCFQPGNPNECRGPLGDANCEEEIEPESQCYCLPLINLTIDIGVENEMPREWENHTYYFQRERVWFGDDHTAVLDTINNVLSSGCVCPDCRDVGDDCMIPFYFVTNPPNRSFSSGDIIKGNLTVDDILFKYHYDEEIDLVPYADSFSFAEGANWTFEYECGLTTPCTKYNTLVPGDCGSECEEQYYRQAHAPQCLQQPLASDATDDAMYRLFMQLDNYSDLTLNCYLDEIDTDDNGVPDTTFDPLAMFFRVEERLKTPSYWGPESVRLVVWT